MVKVSEVPLLMLTGAVGAEVMLVVSVLRVAWVAAPLVAAPTPSNVVVGVVLMGAACAAESVVVHQRRQARHRRARHRRQHIWTLLLLLL